MKHEERRREVIEAALRRFARTGYRKTTIDEVAGDLGMVKSALYKYFPGKEALFGAAIEEIIGQLLAVARRAVARDASAPERLTSLLTETYERMITIVEELRMPIEVWHEARRMVLDRGEADRSFVHLIRDLLRAGRDGGELRLTDATRVAEMIQVLFEDVWDGVLGGKIDRGEGRRRLEHMLQTLMAGLEPR